MCAHLQLAPSEPMQQQTVASSGAVSKRPNFPISFYLFNFNVNMSCQNRPRKVVAYTHSKRQHKMKGTILHNNVKIRNSAYSISYCISYYYQYCTYCFREEEIVFYVKFPRKINYFFLVRAFKNRSYVHQCTVNIISLQRNQLTLIGKDVLV